MRTRLVNPWFVFAHVVALHAVVLWFIGPGQDGPALGASVVEAPADDPLLTEQAVAEGALAPGCTRTTATSWPTWITTGSPS